MGASASIKTQVYQNEMVPFFVEEFERIQKLNLTGDALAAEFQAALTKKMPDLHKQATLIASESGKVINVSGQSSGMPELCHQTLQKILDRSSHTFLVCVDGSNAGDIGLELCLKMRKKQDRYLVFHSYCLGEQAQLHAHYQRDSIKARYENKALLSGLTPLETESVVCMRERTEDEDAKDSISALISEYEEEPNLPPGQSYYLPTASLDFCVIGYTGSKGADKSVTGETVMGSATDQTLRSVRMPVIIVKKAPSDRQALTYVVAVDGSDRSKRGFALIMTLLKPRDRLICLHVIQQQEGFEGDGGETATREVETYFKTEIELFGPPDSQFVALPQTNSTRAELICNYVNEVSDPAPDFLCVSPRARLSPSDEQGSISRGIVHGARCNIIFTKLK